MSDDQNVEMSLVMPFVTVQSKGGPHEDNAYCAGFEMGVLDADLRIISKIGLITVARTIRTDCVPQADLIAMKHEFIMSVRESEYAGWTYVEFTNQDNPYPHESEEGRHVDQ